MGKNKECLDNKKYLYIYTTENVCSFLFKKVRIHKKTEVYPFRPDTIVGLFSTRASNVETTTQTMVTTTTTTNATTTKDSFCICFHYWLAHWLGSSSFTFMVMLFEASDNQFWKFSFFSFSFTSVSLGTENKKNITFKYFCGKWWKKETNAIEYCQQEGTFMQ